MKSPFRALPISLVLTACAFLLPGSRVLASVNGVEPTSDHFWQDIKNDTYDDREHFSKGVGKMSDRLNEERRELREKRAGLKTDTGDWDSAMKEVEDSRDMLTDRMTGLAKVNTPETWEQAKEKISEAWHRAQVAVDKMNATRTS
jgi:hypothetical protein